MKTEIQIGKTSKRIPIFIQDATGAGLTGLLFSSAGLTWYYWREDEGNAAATSVTLATMTRGTWATGGFVEKDATNMPGWYDLGVPNAALASGATWVAMTLKGAAGMVPLNIEIRLTAFDPDNATTLGLTNLDAAVSSRMATYTQPTGFLAATFPSGTIANTTNLTAGTIATVTNIMLANVTQIDGQATNGNNATLNLKQLNVVNSTGDAIVASSTGSNGNGLNASGNGTGAGMLGTGGATGHGLKTLGGATSGSGISAAAATSGSGMVVTGAGSGSGLALTGAGAGNGMSSNGGANGSGMAVTGGGTSGDGLKATVTSGVPIRGNITGDITGNLSGSVGSVTGAVGSVTGAVASVTGAVGSVTGNVGGNVVGSVASVVGAVGSVTGAVGSVTGAVGSVTGAVGSVTGNLGGNVVGSVASVVGAVGSVTSPVTLAASAIQAIWDALTSALTTVGSIGKLIVTNLDALISSRMATYTQPTGFLAATFPSGTLASTTNITAGVITTSTNLTNAPTVGDLTSTMKTSVENAVWNATTAGHTTAGSMGLAQVAPAAGDIWDAVQASHATAGSFGAALQQLYTADVDFRVDTTNVCDRYVARWMINGVPQTSGITVPLITVTNRTTGAVLINAGAMTDVGSGKLYYTALTTERQTAGQQYEVTVTATIAAATRTWTKQLGRDS
jgi:hypothetical protein